MSDVIRWIFVRISSRMLELYEGKLSRTVLRGVGDGNATCLPDRKKLIGDDTESENQDTSPFIEVAMPRSNSVAVELLLTSGNTLRIPVGIDSATLSTILSVVRSVGLC